MFSNQWRSIGPEWRPLLFAAFVGSIAACNSSAERDSRMPVERGEYLVSIMACDDCHSPKVFEDGIPNIDVTHRLAGHPADSAVAPLPKDALGPDRWAFVGNAHMTAWGGPWGVSYAANLTPHKDGLGLWTEEQFVQTMRKGTHLGVGRPVLPPMPWPAYSHMTDDDLRAVYAFLKTLPPIANPVPQPLSPELAEKSPK